MATEFFKLTDEAAGFPPTSPEVSSVINAVIIDGQNRGTKSSTLRDISRILGTRDFSNREIKLLLQIAVLQGFLWVDDSE